MLKTFGVDNGIHAHAYVHKYLTLYLIECLKVAERQDSGGTTTSDTNTITITDADAEATSTPASGDTNNSG